MLTNPTIGAGILDPNEPERVIAVLIRCEFDFPKMDDETWRQVERGAELLRSGCEVEVPLVWISPVEDRLDWFEQLLGDPR